MSESESEVPVLVGVKRDALGFINGIILRDEGHYVALKCAGVASGPDFDVMSLALRLELESNLT